MNVRYHLSQEMINQFTVMNAFQTINQKKVVEGLAEEVQVAMEETIVMVVDLEETDHLEKCTKQLVEIVAMNVRYHLSQEMINQFTVMNAFQTINRINQT